MEQTIPHPFVAASRFGTDAPLRRAMREAYRADEAATVEALLPTATFDEATRRRIERQARDMVAHVRARRRDVGGLDAFMHEYDLSSQVGGRPDVPGRGAAAHSRRRHCRGADPRQDRRGRLAAPPGRQRIALRQRLDLGG
ncbi:MAG: hypothetical protein O3A38_05515 [Proteobacteria bacterium]|nr:hypothetical protein [Pseudomonadota bacterium]